MPLLDQYGNPILPADVRAMREVRAGATITGIRQPISGHPAEGMTPARLAMIHRAAAAGDSLRYMELAEDIEERDLHYAGVLGTRKRQVSQLPITVEAASDDPVHIEHADFLRDWIENGDLEAALFDMLDGIGKGYSVLEIVWDTQPSHFLPEKLIYRPQRWYEVEREDLETICLREAASLVPLAAHKFVVHKHPAKSGLVLRSGIARLASWAWMYKAFTLRDWAVFTQNFGQPIRIGKYGTDAQPADIDTLWRAVANIAGDCAAIIPKTMEIEFQEVKSLGATTENYERRANWLDQQVSKAVLGQTATTDAIAGGHAVGREHRQVQEDVERADARMLSATVNRQLGQPIIAFNFGPQDRYPRIRIGRPDEVPLKEFMDAAKIFAVDMGGRVEASQLRDRIGLDDPEKAKPGKEGAAVEILGGKPPAPAPPAGLPPRPGAPPPPSLHGFRRLVSTHAQRRPEPDLVELMTQRLETDAAAAMDGLTEAVRAEVEAATDMQDLARRLAALELPPEALGAAMGQAMAIAHLAGEAAVLDGLGPREG